MAAYTWDITSTEVLQAVGHPDPTSPTSPGATALTGWLNRFSARLNLALRGLGITPANVTTSSDDELYQACRQAIIGRVGAEWIIHNQRAVPEHAQLLVDEWAQFLRDLRERPSHMVGETGHTLKPETGPARTIHGELSNSLNRPLPWITESGGFQ